MSARIAFIFIALFWLTMNALLWQSEYGAREPGGSAVPAEMVWRRILNAPDSSSLSVVQRGKKIGFCHWVTSVGEEFARLDDAPPGGMAQGVSGYRVYFDGNVILPEYDNRARFECNLKLSTNRLWQELTVRLNVRPASWEVRSVASEQSVRVKADDGEAKFERVFKFSELQNPEGLLREFTGPFTYGLLGGLGLPVMPQTGAMPGLGVKWEAYNDTLSIGHEPLRVYRLQTKLLDRYRVVIFVSRAGEILRAELPQEVVLMHDQLASY